MSDTPETDAAELIYDGIVASGYADVDKCRKLERERDEARNCFKVAMETAGTYKRERDEAREALRFIAEWGGRTLESEYGDIDCNGKWCAEQAKEALK